MEKQDILVGLAKHSDGICQIVAIEASLLKTLDYSAALEKYQEIQQESWFDDDNCLQEVRDIILETFPGAEQSDWVANEFIVQAEEYSDQDSFRILADTLGFKTSAEFDRYLQNEFIDDSDLNDLFDSEAQYEQQDFWEDDSLMSDDWTQMQFDDNDQFSDDF